MNPFIPNAQIYAKNASTPRSTPLPIETSSPCAVNNGIKAVNLSKIFSPRFATLALATVATVAIGVKLCRKAREVLNFKNRQASEAASKSKTVSQDSSMAPLEEGASRHDEVSHSDGSDGNHSQARHTASQATFPATNVPTNPPILQESESNGGGNLPKVSEERKENCGSRNGYTIVTGMVVDISPPPPNMPKKEAPNPSQQQCSEKVRPSFEGSPRPKPKVMERRNPFATSSCSPQAANVGTGIFKFGGHSVASTEKKQIRETGSSDVDMSIGLSSEEAGNKIGCAAEQALSPGVQRPLGSTRSTGRFVHTERPVKDRKSRKSSVQSRSRGSRKKLSLENTEARAHFAAVFQTGNFHPERPPQTQRPREEIKVPEPEDGDFDRSYIETRELQYMGTEDI